MGSLPDPTPPSAHTRERRLALAIAVAIAGAASLATLPSRALHAASSHEALPGGTGTIRTVTNCSDSDKGSLRDIVQNVAQSGDIVDLSQLPALCESAVSTITLTSGEIVAPQYDLTLLGPAPGTGTVTISGNGASRVLNGTAPINGFGKVFIRDLSFVDGYVSDDTYATGGCIRTFEYVSLYRVNVSGCSAVSSTGSAFGGGVYAGILQLTESTISGNTIHAAELANGAGAATGTLEGKYSSISGNSATSDAGTSYGGGGFVFSAFLYHMTIDHNEAEYGSALDTRGYKPMVIQNSTISGNVGGSGTIRAVTPENPITGSVVDYLRIANSTIAFNHSTREDATGAIHFEKRPENLQSAVLLESSIVAKNTAGAANAPADIYIMGDPEVDGHDNLVIASNVSPPGLITVTSDPVLGPLQNNGGTTLTHSLLSGSPAIGAGNADVTFPYQPNEFDQRGFGHPRSRIVAGVAVTDIGAVQYDTLFANGFEL